MNSFIQGFIVNYVALLRLCVVRNKSSVEFTIADYLITYLDQELSLSSFLMDFFVNLNFLDWHHITQMVTRSVDDSKYFFFIQTVLPIIEQKTDYHNASYVDKYLYPDLTRIVRSYNSSLVPSHDEEKHEPVNMIKCGYLREVIKHAVNMTEGVALIKTKSPEFASECLMCILKRDPDEYINGVLKWILMILKQNNVIVNIDWQQFSHLDKQDFHEVFLEVLGYDPLRRVRESRSITTSSRFRSKSPRRSRNSPVNGSYPTESKEQPKKSKRRSRRHRRSRRSKH